MKRRILGAEAALGMLALILDSRTALLCAREGVQLCLQTVIPALFPFLILSSLVLDGKTEWRILRPLGRLMRMPEGTQELLLPAFFGGYPLGAQSVARAWRGGQLGKEDTQRMLAYCNNCGPAFLFGMAASLFPEAWMGWALWGIHIGSAILTAQLFPSTGRVASLPEKPKSDPLPEAVRVMGVICGWVVLFRVVIGFCKRWVLWLLPPELQVLCMGLLELTNGCFALPVVQSIPARFTLCSLMLSLGGLCVAMQTASVTKGLSLRYYWCGKLLQAGFSLVLSLCLFRPQVLLVPMLAVLGIILVERQKRSSISQAAGV